MMSATVVETSTPGWILKLLSEQKEGDFFKQKYLDDYKLANGMAHKCAAEKNYTLIRQTPPPPPPPVKPTSATVEIKSPVIEPATTSSTPEALFSALTDRIIPQISNSVNSPQISNFVSVPQTARHPVSNAKLDYFCEVLTRIREPIVLYEEQKGVPRDLQYSFMSLMSSLAHQTYNALFTIFTMLINLIPLAEGFLQMLRFIIDKSIDICVTQNKKDKALKLIVFAGELVIMFFTALLITGIIFIPVLNLLFYAFVKLWALVLPH